MERVYKRSFPMRVWIVLRAILFARLGVENEALLSSGVRLTDFLQLIGWRSLTFSGELNPEIFRPAKKETYDAWVQRAHRAGAKAERRISRPFADFRQWYFEVYWNFPIPPLFGLGPEERFEIIVAEGATPVGREEFLGSGASLLLLRPEVLSVSSPRWKGLVVPSPRSLELTVYADTDLVGVRVAKLPPN